MSHVPLLIREHAAASCFWSEKIKLHCVPNYYAHPISFSWLVFPKQSIQLMFFLSSSVLWKILQALIHWTCVEFLPVFHWRMPVLSIWAVVLRKTAPRPYRPSLWARGKHSPWRALVSSGRNTASRTTASFFVLRRLQQLQMPVQQWCSTAAPLNYEFAWQKISLSLYLNSSVLWITHKSFNSSMISLRFFSKYRLFSCLFARRAKTANEPNWNPADASL